MNIRSLSIEFFPPQTPEGFEKLRSTRDELARLKPEFYSVTFGAGGSTRDRTLETVLDIHQAGFAAAPHLSCIGATPENLRELIGQYRAAGIRRIVALRGDLPSGAVALGGFRYASDLVAFIRAETGDWFHLEVAAYPEVHPQALSPDQDLASLRNKVNAGANSAITQYFYNADAYFAFCDQARRVGVEVPIVPGIMPISNFSKVARFSEMCGAEIPRWIRTRMQAYGDDAEAVRGFGLDVVTRLCERLIAGGAPGLHFYTLNQAALTAEICRRLGVVAA